ncbi:MAG TPA: S8 family serine peptidase [Candidatus Polarisedimenticolia bacterium]|nr:S8 family serine peptidase [Candidatus Polarisedimenticolia bacterium]
MLGPEGRDRFGRKRFTGNSLIALNRDVRKRERIHQTVDTLAAEVQRFRFDGDADAFRRQTTILPEFGVATVPISPSVLADLIIEQPELQGHIVARERYLYAPAPLAGNTITLSPLARMNVVDRTPGGRGVKVAVLDTGYADHPDFGGRRLDKRSAIFGESPTDIDGHGTHCLGLACGPKAPTDPTIDRYGVAWDADILAIRVLVDRQTGTDTSILLGMLAARLAGAAIINLSLGSSVQFDEPYNVVFELVARQLLDQDVLTIAAAGNCPDLARFPVEHPANCPSVMAVGAVDHNFKKWGVSCVEANDCSRVDIAAPGEGIRSSSIGGGYAYESGTSMAAAFASGVAALWAGRNPDNRGRRLWIKLSENADTMPGDEESVGAGIVQAPS